MQDNFLHWDLSGSKSKGIGNKQGMLVPLSFLGSKRHVLITSIVHRKLHKMLGARYSMTKRSLWHGGGWPPHSPAWFKGVSAEQGRRGRSRMEITAAGFETGTPMARGATSKSSSWGALPKVITRPLSLLQCFLQSTFYLLTYYLLTYLVYCSALLWIKTPWGRDIFLLCTLMYL